MRLLQFTLFFHLCVSLVLGASIPDVRDVATRAESDYYDILDKQSDGALVKRKGGGGGKGGSSGGKSGSSGSSSSSSSSGGRSGGSSFSPSSNAGGRTRAGSGTPAAYGTGPNRYYAGGASVPFTSGRRTSSGVTPFILPLGASAFIFPGLWYHPIYAYPYTHPYVYRNTTNTSSDSNSSIPVTCLCEQYAECGCDDTGSDNNTALVSEMMNSTEPRNSSLVKYVEFENGTSQLYVNGTLENGTTASGGTDPSSANDVSGAQVMARASGYWIMVATVLAAVFMA